MAPEEDLEAGPDEWIVEKIVFHRAGCYSKREFLTVWQGDPTNAWEPVKNFLHRYGCDLIVYCKREGISLNVIDYLDEVPSLSEAAQLGGIFSRDVLSLSQQPN